MARGIIKISYGNNFGPSMATTWLRHVSAVEWQKRAVEAGDEDTCLASGICQTPIPQRINSPSNPSIPSSHRRCSGNRTHQPPTDISTNAQAQAHTCGSGTKPSVMPFRKRRARLMLFFILPMPKTQTLSCRCNKINVNTNTNVLGETEWKHNVWETSYVFWFFKYISKIALEFRRCYGADLPAYIFPHLLLKKRASRQKTVWINFCETWNDNDW